MLWVCGVTTGQMGGDGGTRRGVEAVGARLNQSIRRIPQPPHCLPEPKQLTSSSHTHPVSVIPTHTPVSSSPNGLRVHPSSLYAYIRVLVALDRTPTHPLTPPQDPLCLCNNAPSYVFCCYLHFSTRRRSRRNRSRRLLQGHTLSLSSYSRCDGPSLSDCGGKRGGSFAREESIILVGPREKCCLCLAKSRIGPTPTE